MLEFERPSYVEVPMSTLQSSGPANVAHYLLAASPPGVECFTLSSKTDNVSVPTTHTQTTESSTDSTEMAPQFSLGVNEETENSVETCAPSDCPDTMGCTETAKPTGMGKKKVSFADDLGYNLATVKIMYESSDTPPWLNPEVIRKLTQGLDQGETDCEESSLVLNFRQPAADYQVFREKVDKNKVSLENVILKGTTVTGTVKVANVAFHKLVTIRYSCDKWATSTDVPASFVPNGRQGQSDKYDTFSFKFDVPRGSCDNILFCICYDVEGQQFWDSNGGQNYEILRQDLKKTESQFNGLTVSKCHEFQDSGRAWSEFSVWTGVDKSVPYW